MRSQEEILLEALELPAGARAEVAERLLRSLDGPDQTGIEAAWADEIEQRIEHLDRGETQVIAGDKVMDKLKARLG